MTWRDRPKWFVWPLVAVTSIVAAAAVAWFLVLPRFRPDLLEGERLGIDVSHHQGVIDWRAVADDGITFAYIKATEGSDFVDPRFLVNWESAGDARLDRGAYHFFSLCSAGSAQARNFLGTVPKDGELAPAVDLELIGPCSKRPTPARVASELERFLVAVEEDLGPMLIYASNDFVERYGLPPGGRAMWRLGFLRRPADDWLVWQVGGFADVHGIVGRVDLNVMRTGMMRG